jgi:hypothetical protein
MEASVFYGLKFPARSISAVLGDAEHHRFIVGTHHISEQNEIHVIEFDEESNDVVCLGVFTHAPEIHTISTHPTNPDLFATVYRSRKSPTQKQATVWKCHQQTHKMKLKMPKHSTTLQQHHWATC